jgi:hypothetical protein
MLTQEVNLPTDNRRVTGMIQVRFTTSKFDAESTEWVELPIAELVADRDELTISGPHADWISPDISIVDPDSGGRVTRADGAERWARLLPFAYRNGDITVEVVEMAAAQPAGAAFHYSAGH